MFQCFRAMLKRGRSLCRQTVSILTLKSFPVVGLDAQWFDCTLKALNYKIRCAVQFLLISPTGNQPRVITVRLIYCSAAIFLRQMNNKQN